MFAFVFVEAQLSRTFVAQIYSVYIEQFWRTIQVMHVHMLQTHSTQHTRPNHKACTKALASSMPMHHWQNKKQIQVPPPPPPPLAKKFLDMITNKFVFMNTLALDRIE